MKRLQVPTIVCRMMFGILICSAAHSCTLGSSKVPVATATVYGSKEAAENDSILTVHNDAKPMNMAGKSNRELPMILQKLTLKNTAVKTKKTIVDKIAKTEVFGSFILVLLLLLVLCMRCKN